MNIYRVLGLSIAESVNAVGAAVRGLGQATGSNEFVAPTEGWTDQFSDASLDDNRARRTVEALYRGAVVRL